MLMMNPPAEASPAGKVSSHANSKAIGRTGAAVNPSSPMLTSTAQKLLVVMAPIVTMKKEVPKVVARQKYFLYLRVLFICNIKKIEPTSPEGIITAPNTVISC